jgi:hypothetical protein
MDFNDQCIHNAGKIKIENMLDTLFYNKRWGQTERYAPTLFN